MENTDRVPRLDLVERLAHVLGVSPCHLAYGVPGPAAGSDALRWAAVGERLRWARLQAGLSLSRLGQKSGTSGQNIGKLEAGDQAPGIDTVERLADALGVPPCWLAFGDGPVSVSPGPGTVRRVSLPEADTRAKLIDPALHARGWTEDHVKREETLGAVVVQDGVPRRSGGRADYVLRVPLRPDTQPIAVAILEAKREGKPPGHSLDQAKTYAAACARQNVLFAYSANGYQFVEYDCVTGRTSPQRPMAEFPAPDELRARYERHMGFSLDDPAAKPLLIRYPGGEGQRRYYQDAAIRAVLEKIVQSALHGQPPRTLLSLATGSGKTLIAVHLLQRISDAGQLRRALFVSDRDEHALRAFSTVFGTNAQRAYETSAGRNHAQDARVHIATYATLGDPSFLERHYPADFFSHIIIDECHRPAWGQWSAVLARNAGAVHIGLTAAPGHLECEEDTAKARQDRQISDHNLEYFGPPVYEYSLAQAVEDGYLAACRIVRRTGFESQSLPDCVEAMCADLFTLLQASDPERGPEQQTIIYCAQDQHAGQVAAALNLRYAAWCMERGVERKDPFIVTASDLPQTGVDVPAVRNIVFFRYLKSPISFHQMLGRGTRIDEPTGKLLFTVYDYTAATRLFTQDFVTRARAATGTVEAKDEGETDYARKRPPPPVRVEGFDVHVSPLGRYVVTAVGGRAMPISMEDYRKGLAAQLVDLCPSVEIFRSKWVSAAERKELLDGLVAAGYSPAVVRMLQEMDEYDLFDVLGDLGYGLSPRTREDRVAAFRYKNEAWLAAMPMQVANTIRAIARQFIADGTEGLENPRIWYTPEVISAGGRRVLKQVGEQLGEPAAILREAKVRMFAP